MNLEIVWSEYRAALESFLHSKISNSADVEDLLQEILIKSYQNIDTLKSDESIKSWLYQITKNSITDFYRKNNKVAKLNHDELWYSEISDIEGVKQSLSKCVLPFINTLPRETAELLISIDIEGQSQKEYANQNNISYSTLKSKVQKGRRDLRQLFNDCCHFNFDKHGNIMGFDPKSNSCKNC